MLISTPIFPSPINSIYYPILLRFCFIWKRITIWISITIYTKFRRWLYSNSFYKFLFILLFLYLFKKSTDIILFLLIIIFIPPSFYLSDHHTKINYFLLFMCTRPTSIMSLNMNRFIAFFLCHIFYLLYILTWTIEFLWSTAWFCLFFLLC